MKKIAKIFIMLFLLVAVIPMQTVFAAGRKQKIDVVFGQTKFTINGVPLKQDSILYNGTAYLPASYIAKQLGLSANWNSNTNVTTLDYSYATPVAVVDNSVASLAPTKKTIDAIFGATKYIINGEYLTQESLLYDGSAYLPASLLAKELGFSAKWNQKTNVTNIVFVNATSVSFDKTKMLVSEDGEKVQLNPIINPSNATIKAMSYKSSDTNIVDVTSDGTLIAKNNGTVEITGTTINGLQAKCKVEVVVPVSDISISFDKNALKVGQTATLKVEVHPYNATDKSYEVKVNQNEIELLSEGVFRANATGQLNVTVVASNGVSAEKAIDAYDLKALADEVLRLTNIERAKEGISPLTGTNNALNDVAMLRATETIALFSHDRPNGTSCWTAYDEFGVSGASGENIASGYGSPSDVVEGWMNSPGHRKNILNSSSNELGVGVDIDENGRFYWTQNFKR